MIRGWTRFLCLFFLFCNLGIKCAFGAEPDWEKMQQIREELERLADEAPGEVNSDEFKEAADTYIQMLIESKGESSTGIISEYITDPDVTAEFAAEHFVYTLPNLQRFYSSVPKGTMITAPVHFIPVEGALVTVKKDGKVIERPKSDVYKETGSYEVKMVAYGDGNVQLEAFNVYEVTFCFRIIDTYTKDVNYAYPPEEYRIGGINHEGEGLPVSGGGSFLLKDGSYEIWYESPAYPQKQYKFSFTRDTQPPGIKFKNQNAGNTYESPAEFQVNEPLRDFYIIYNGMRLDDPSFVLESEGNYYIVAVDQAGNQSEVLVRIKENHLLWGNLWIIVIIILLAVSIGFVLYSRRKNIRIL
ncbi:MAG: hypothetical protein LIP16_10785 [Clostridium sp.]|nr:hypothetical protein [Clostridium sp.]